MTQNSNAERLKEEFYMHNLDEFLIFFNIYFITYYLKVTYGFILKFSISFENSSAFDTYEQEI